MNRAKGIDKQALEELIFGAYHLSKINRYMQNLRNCAVRICVSGGYMERPAPQVAHFSFKEVYDSSEGGPP